MAERADGAGVNVRARRWLLIALALLAALLVVGRLVASTYADYRWYAALGAADVWRAAFINTSLLRALQFVLGSVFAFANLYAFRHSIVSFVLPRRVGNLEIGEEVPGSMLLGAMLVIAVLLGGLLSIPTASWTTLALARSGVPFGESDPFRQIDLGYYVYWVPLESALWAWGLIALLSVTLIVVFLYALTPSLRWERGHLHMSGYVRRHFALLAALFLCMLAWSYRLDLTGIMQRGSGPQGAFGYADHNIGLVTDVALAMLTLGIAFVVAVAGWAGQVRVAVGAIVVLIGTSILARNALPPFVVRSADTADPVVRERPYVATRAGYTRRAYALDRIERADSLIAFTDAADVAHGVPIWDPVAVNEAIAHTLRGSPIGDVGLAVEHGALVYRTIVRPGENGAEEGRGPWMLVRTLATAADDRGQIVRVDTAGGATTEDAVMLAPTVYPGASAYTVVPDSNGGLVAPAVDRFADRLSFAWMAQNVRLLAQDLPSPRPKILLHRDVRDRIAELAPFFTQGRTVTPIPVRDTLMWTVDLYSTSTDYPLSAHVIVGGEEYSYYQHAATAIVNGVSGRVWLVADSSLDPVAQSWVAMFPRMFIKWDRVPSAIVAALPPLTESAQAQAVGFAQFGTRAEPALPRHLPIQDGSEGAAAGNAPLLAWPAHAGVSESVQPLLDGGENVVGLLVATGGSRRGTWWYPLPREGPRWESIIDRLANADSATAETPITRGRVRSFPFGDGAAFGQAAYRWPTGAAPVLMRIALLDRDSVVTGTSMAAALGQPTRAPIDGMPRTPEEFRARVAALYDAMRSAMRRGDWTAFGAAYTALGQLMGRTPQ